MAQGGRKEKPDLDEAIKVISKMQESNSRAYRFKTMHKLTDAEKEKVSQDIVGGFIHGYQFDEHLRDNGVDMAHGFLVVECKNKTSPPTHLPATFLKTGRTTAERMYEHALKLKGSRAIAALYLIANCEELKKWIICYEELIGYLTDNLEGLGPFYSSASEMSKYWQNQLRAIISALSDMGKELTYHGGMSSSKSYTLSKSKDIKLIGVRKNADGTKTLHGDLLDLEKFLRENPKISANTSPDWKGFQLLIQSAPMLKLDTWAGDVLGHPLLLDPEERLLSYVDLHVWTDRILLSEKIDFSNVLCCLLPDYDGKMVNSFITGNDKLVRIHANDTYNGRNIYMDIIKFVKNMIRHGRALLDKDLLGTINLVFPGFMSVAYAVSKIEPSDRRKLLVGCKLRFTISNC